MRPRRGASDLGRIGAARGSHKRGRNDRSPLEARRRKADRKAHPQGRTDNTDVSIRGSGYPATAPYWLPPTRDFASALVGRRPGARNAQPFEQQNGPKERHSERPCPSRDRHAAANGRLRDSWRAAGQAESRLEAALGHRLPEGRPGGRADSRPPAFIR